MLWLQQNWIQNLIIGVSLVFIGMIFQLIAIVKFQFKLVFVSMPSIFIGGVFFLLFAIGLISVWIQQAKV